MTETMLGKISAARYGRGGYQDEMFGLSLTFSGKGWGTGTFKGTWSASIECTTHSKWSEADRSKLHDETARFTDALLISAKVGDVSKLVGIPVEVTFEGGILKDWRVLTEVL